MPTPAQLNQVSSTGLSYCELDDGLEEGADATGLYARKSYLCAWADRWRFLKELRGSATLTGGTGGTVTRVIPAKYPDFPYLYATDAKITPVGGNRGRGVNQIQYTYAQLDVSYRTPDFNFEGAVGQNDTGEPAVDSVTFGTVGLTFSCDFLSVPEKYQYVFETGGAPVGQSIGIRVPQMEYSVTRHMLPYLPVKLLTTMVGALNNAAFLGFSAETLLFTGAGAKRSATQDGWQAWDLDYKFLWRPVSWNKFLSPAGGWDYVKDPSNVRVYGTKDFTTLP